jgi:hypothetical protein
LPLAGAIRQWLARPRNDSSLRRLNPPNRADGEM